MHLPQHIPSAADKFCLCDAWQLNMKHTKHYIIYTFIHQASIHGGNSSACNFSYCCDELGVMTNQTSEMLRS